MKKLYFAVSIAILLATLAILGAGNILANSRLEPVKLASEDGVYRVESQFALTETDQAAIKAAAANFGGSRKEVNSANAKRGDVLTYTIVISNSGSSAATARVTDTMPSELSSGILFFPTDISGTVIFPTTGMGGGSLNLPTGGDWVWTGVISAYTQVELILRAQLSTDVSEIVAFSNQIQINNEAPIFSQMTTYDPFVYLYLPIALKNYPPSLPPVTCAPTHLIDVQVGQGPRGIAIDEGRNRIYVANYADGSLSVIDGNSSLVIKTINGLPGANGIAYNPDKDKIWVTNFDSDQATPINAATFAVETPLSVGDQPWGIVYNPQDGKIYVANSGSDSVSVIDANGSLQLPAIGVGDQPYNLAVHKVTGLVYVANYGSHTVSVLNANGTFRAPIDLTDSSQPFGIAVDDVIQDYVYVTTVNSNRIVVIDADTNLFVDWNSIERRDTSATGAPLRALALNMSVNTSEKGHLWTTTSESDGSDHTQILLVPKGFSDGFFDDPIPDPATPDSISDDLKYAGIAVNVKTNRVYVSLTANNSVRILGDADDKCFPVPFRSTRSMVAVPAH